MPSPLKTLADATKGLKFTESPRWHDGKLWFIDIHEKRIKTVDPSGCVATVLEVPFIPNAFGLTPEGTIVVGDAFHRKIYRKAAGKLEQTADIGSLTTFCLSDGIVDARGRLYVGDIGYNFIDPKAEPVETCVIVLVGQDGGASVVSDKLFFPNGMVITPDGIGLDADGAVWCANPEGADSVVRVREGGEITDRIQVATHAYAVMLGGPERRHLFISTSASHDPAEILRHPSASLQVVEVDVPGAGTP